MKIRWEMSSSQAYTKPGALVGLRMWKVLLWVKSGNGDEERRGIVIYRGKKQTNKQIKRRLKKLLKWFVRVHDVPPEGRERLEVDGLQHVLGSVELQQQHDEDSVVRQLLELRLTDVVVLNQHADDDAQHLQRATRRSSGAQSAKQQQQEESEAFT